MLIYLIENSGKKIEYLICDYWTSKKGSELSKQIYTVIEQITTRASAKVSLGLPFT